MNILVTGASGFIATHLIEQLTQNSEFFVYGLSRSFITQTGNRFYQLNADMTEMGWTCCLPSNIDVIIHLAQSRCYKSFPDGAADMLNVNTKATLELLEWSRINRIDKFIYASTGNVYKLSPEIHSEEDECKPDSMYAATKLSAEHLVQQYSQFFSTTIMRIFGVYGAGQKNMIIPEMIHRVNNGTEITLARGVGIFLTPLYISDCVGMISKLILRPQSLQNQILNIAGDSVLNLSEIINIIGNILEKKPQICITNEESVYFLGDLTKFRREIGWETFVSFADGILKTIHGRRI